MNEIEELLAIDLTMTLNLDEWAIMHNSLWRSVCDSMVIPLRNSIENRLYNPIWQYTRVREAIANIAENKIKQLH